MTHDSEAMISEQGQRSRSVGLWRNRAEEALAVAKQANDNCERLAAAANKVLDELDEADDADLVLEQIYSLPELVALLNRGSAQGGLNVD